METLTSAKLTVNLPGISKTNFTQLRLWPSISKGTIDYLQTPDEKAKNHIPRILWVS